MTRAKAAAFWALSCTWGIIMTLLGAIGALVFLAMGHRPVRVGYSYMFAFGSGWGSATLGPFIFASEGNAASRDIRLHEAGHSIQNCIWGVLFPFVIAIPSLISAAADPAGHRGRWFELQATALGYKYCDF